MEGIVLKSTGSWHTVRDKNGRCYDCKIKGRFRIKGIKTTNPIAIGDRVNFSLMEDKKTGVITEILERSNYIIRKATKLSKQSHIIAANIDQAILIVTLAEPRTSTGFIDRFLVTAEAYHIPANIVFNKIDIYDEQLWSTHNKIKTVYEKAGYSCFEISIKEGKNITSIKKLLANKTNLLSGHSGVGKSALINKIQPGLNIKTAGISDYYKKGRHTTTFAEMHVLSFGGYIIDTPGIKEFGLVDFDKKEIAERFPEMRKLMHSCRYNNCTHIHEPGCAVVDALKHNEISEFRYNNYRNIVNDDYFSIKQY